MSARAIGIDIGTSGVRAIAVEAGGRACGGGSATLPDGEARRDPRAWWAAVEAALGQLRAVVELSQVRAVAVDGTSGTMLAVDAGGEPVAPPLMYGDACTDDAILARIEAHAPAASAARGRTSALARVLQLQEAAGAVMVLHQADWVAGRLSGRLGVSDENNALKTGYDPLERCWPEWIAATGARMEMLPQVLEPGAPVGPVGPLGRALGLPGEAMLMAGTTDGCASFLATGASKVGEGVTALGSTLVIKLLSDRPISAPQYGVYSHRIGGNWLAGGASNTGGNVIAHLFARERLDHLTAAIDPDRPTGLDYYPLVKPGERFPINDPGLLPRLEPRPKDEETFFQAVLEGIAKVEHMGYARLTELGGPKLVSVRTVGGGAANAGWARIRERLIGAPFLPAASEEAAQGTARLALRGLEQLEGTA